MQDASEQNSGDFLKRFIFFPVAKIQIIKPIFNVEIWQFQWGTSRESF